MAKIFNATLNLGVVCDCVLVFVTVPVWTSTSLNPAKADSTSESTLVGLSFLARSVYRRAMTDGKDAFWRGAHPVCRGVIGIDGGGDEGQFLKESKSLPRLIQVLEGFFFLQRKSVQQNLHDFAAQARIQMGGVGQWVVIYAPSFRSASSRSG